MTGTARRHLVVFFAILSVPARLDCGRLGEAACATTERVDGDGAQRWRLAMSYPVDGERHAADDRHETSEAHAAHAARDVAS